MKIDFWNVNSKARIVNYRRFNASENSAGISLKSQAETYEEDKQRFGWTTVAIAEDVGSGNSRERKGIKKLIELVNESEVDAIYLISTDLLATDKRLYDELIEFFAENNVSVLCPQGLLIADSRPKDYCYHCCCRNHLLHDDLWS